jgi:hypothetical protein
MDNLYLFEILRDDPKNIKRINDTLHDIKNSLFTTLYQAQRALSDFQSVTMDFSNHRPLRHNRIVFDVSHTYIEGVARCNFRRSKFYRREVLCDDIFRNTDVFTKGVLVFINGLMVTNFYVYFDEDRIEIRFARYLTYNGVPNDGMTMSTIDELTESGAKITIVIMPICKKAVGNTTTQNIINNEYKISRYAGYLNGLSYINVGDTPWLFVSILHDSYRLTGRQYICADYTEVGENLIVDEGVFANVANKSRTTSIDMFFPDSFLLKKTVSNDGWFAVPIQNMPVPKENMLVFRKHDSGLILDHTATIDMYYPNIYHINSDYDGEYIVYVFYNPDTDHIGITHTNELALYTTFIDGVTEYADDTIPEYIKTYEPVSMQYNIDDYENSGIEETLEYKIERLRAVIKENPMLYKYYLKRYVDTYPNVFDVVSDEDYTSRLRNDTSKELPNLPTVIFDSPRYMFSMRRENNAQVFRFFIDNKAYHVTNNETMFYDDNFAYFYISTEYIHVGSHIEIQKLHNNMMSQEYVVDTSVPTKITLDPLYMAAAEDLFITHNTGTIEEYITDGFTLCIKLDNNREPTPDDIVIDNVTYRPINDIIFERFTELYLIWDNDDLNGETISIRSDKYNIQMTGFDGTATVDLDRRINRDRRNFLIFRDGRLMSPKGIKLRYGNDYNGTHRVQALLTQEEGVEITAQHMPDKYNLVCDYADDYVKRLRIYQKYLDTDEAIYGREDNIYDKQIECSEELRNRILETGHYVDLTNLITKPLDFRWYEIYMNGLKLTEKDVIFIGAYQMIITLYDDYPDIDSFVISDMIGFIEKYVIPLPFLNPDWEQVTDEMIYEYPELMDRRNNVVFDGDTQLTMTSSILLNPDEELGIALSDVHVTGGDDTI